MNKVCLYFLFDDCDISSFLPDNTRNAARAVIQVSFVTDFTLSEADRTRWTLALVNYDTKNSGWLQNRK